MILQLVPTRRNVCGIEKFASSGEKKKVVWFGLWYTAKKHMVVVCNFPYCFPLQNVFLQMENIYFCKWQMYLSTVCKVSVDCSAATPRPLRRPSSIPAITQTAPAASISYITNIWPMQVDIEHIYSKISSTHYTDWHDWDNVLIHWRPSIASLWQLSFLNGVLQSQTINDLKKINWDEEQRLENKQKS